MIDGQGRANSAFVGANTLFIRIDRAFGSTNERIIAANTSFAVPNVTGVVTNAAFVRIFAVFVTMIGARGASKAAAFAALIKNPLSLRIWLRANFTSVLTPRWRTLIKVLDLLTGIYILPSSDASRFWSSP